MARKRMDFRKYTLNRVGDTQFSKGIRRVVYLMPSNYILSASNHIVFLNNYVATLPDASDHSGREFVIHNSGAQASTLLGITGVTLQPGDTATVISDGATWHRLY